MMTPHGQKKIVLVTRLRDFPVCSVKYHVIVFTYHIISGQAKPTDQEIKKYQNGTLQLVCQAAGKCFTPDNRVFTSDNAR